MMVRSSTHKCVTRPQWVKCSPEALVGVSCVHLLYQGALECYMQVQVAILLSCILTPIPLSSWSRHFSHCSLIAVSRIAGQGLDLAAEIQPGAHFTNGSSVAIQIRWNIPFTVTSIWINNRYKFFTWHYRPGMSKNLLRYNDQYNNHSKAKLSSNLN